MKFGKTVAAISIAASTLVSGQALAGKKIAFGCLLQDGYYGVWFNNANQVSFNDRDYFESSVTRTSDGLYSISIGAFDAPALDLTGNGAVVIEGTRYACNAGTLTKDTGLLNSQVGR